MSSLAVEHLKARSERVRRDSDLMFAVGYGGGAIVYTAFVLTLHAFTLISLWTLLVPGACVAVFAPLITRNLLRRRRIANPLDGQRIAALEDGALRLLDAFLAEPGKPLVPMSLPYKIEWDGDQIPSREFTACMAWLDALVGAGLVERLPSPSAHAQSRYQATTGASAALSAERGRRVLAQEAAEAARFRVARPGARTRRSPLAE